MDVLPVPLNAILREFNIFLGFSWRDWSVTIIPGSIFSIGAMRTAHLAPASILYRFLFLVIWLTLYVYFFDLSNQITGVDEDRINKPDRPIPSGKVTLYGAKVRWALALTAFLSISVYESTLLPEAICWVATTAFLSLTPGGSHWFGKNCVALTAGTWSLLSASWRSISPTTPQIDCLIFSLAVWAGMVAQIADLRDIKGDTLIGRKTLPLAFGDAMSRRIIAYFFLPICFCALSVGGVIAMAPFPLAFAHLFLAYRVMQPGGARYDHKTYMVCLFFNIFPPLLFCCSKILISRWSPTSSV